MQWEESVDRCVRPFAADPMLLTRCLLQAASLSAAGKFNYNRFFAIGLFRLLELTGAKEPAALEKLVKAMGVRPDLVNKDLMTYKSVLSKMSVAKELMREFLEREKRKQAERAAEKAGKTESAPVSTSTESTPASA